jgi:hypothetical protein
LPELLPALPDPSGLVGVLTSETATRSVLMVAAALMGTALARAGRVTDAVAVLVTDVRVSFEGVRSVICRGLRLGDASVIARSTVAAPELPAPSERPHEDSSSANPTIALPSFPPSGQHAPPGLFTPPLIESAATRGVWRLVLSLTMIVGSIYVAFLAFWFAAMDALRRGPGGKAVAPLRRFAPGVGINVGVILLAMAMVGIWVFVART